PSRSVATAGPRRAIGGRQSRRGYPQSDWRNRQNAVICPAVRRHRHPCLSGTRSTLKEKTVAKTSRSTLMILAAIVVVAAGAVIWYVSRPQAVILEGEAGSATAAAPAGASDALMVAGPLGEMVLGDP